MLALITGMVATPSVFPLSAGINSRNLFKNNVFYTDPDSEAYKSFQKNNSQLIQRIAYTPQAKWFTGIEDNITQSVFDFVNSANEINQLPVLVAYNLPFRDCGGYSKGGAASERNYKKWIDGFVAGIGENEAVVIFEPDGLGLLECGDPLLKIARLELYNYAMDAFVLKPNISVYIDASMWIDPEIMANYLTLAGVERARGISVNVSSFNSNENAISYIEQINSELGFNVYGVIDSSRNGAESLTDEWCNPSNKRLGVSSTSDTNHELIDAFFWIKRPGESDGLCNGGPNAGLWWEEYALELAQEPPVKEIQVVETPAEIDLSENTEDAITEIEVIEDNTSVEEEYSGTDQQGVSSTITIHAAGTIAEGIYPEFELQINEVPVKVFSNVQGNPYSKETKEFVYSQTERIDIKDVKIVFTNDYSNSYQDRNLFVDKVNIDGVDFETEDITTQTLGTWSNNSGCALGNKKSEWLHCSGYIQFSASSKANAVSNLVIYAAGTPVNGIYPDLDLYIQDKKVFEFKNIQGNPYSGNLVELIYSQESKVDIEDVKIKFTNDVSTAYEDRNLFIDKVSIDGIEYQIEDSNVYSIGSWSNDNGCNGGFKRSQWLHCSGEFSFVQN